MGGRGRTGRWSRSVPRVTLTFPVLESCRASAFLVSGAGKKAALARVLAGEDLPAARLKPLGPLSGSSTARPPGAGLSAKALPSVILVMGVSGAGKSTVGRKLAEALDRHFLDADELHSPENRARMQAGVPLTDADRAPWLDAVSAWIARRRAEGRSSVVAGSALKRAYRDMLRAANPDLLIVELHGPAELIRERMKTRTGHFMPVSLLESQLAALEPPGADERAIRVSIEDTPEAIVERVLAA